MQLTTYLLIVQCVVSISIQRVLVHVVLLICSSFPILFVFVLSFPLLFLITLITVHYLVGPFVQLHLLLLLRYLLLVDRRHTLVIALTRARIILNVLRNLRRGVVLLCDSRGILRGRYAQILTTRFSTIFSSSQWI